MWLVGLLTSPRLYWIYPQADHTTQNANLGHSYVQNSAEIWGQTIVSSILFFTELSVYLSPMICVYVSRRMESFQPRSFGVGVAAISTLFCFGIILRTFGRFRNPAYLKFFSALRKAQQKFTSETKEELSRYDFEFWAWPREFSVRDLPLETRLFSTPSVESLCHRWSYLPHRVLGWMMINSFGLKLIYPGSTKWLLQSLIGPALAENRAKLVIKSAGQRVKLHTRDGNDIDSMFFDKRGVGSDGDTLVIVCEGNAGFYELGMLTTPLDAGYSVLGWNHPGFWGSTGSPLPSQDGNAAEVVMQYAIEHLKFPQEKIVVYGWSIGGFSASWMAMNYPKVKGVVLDATFDHLAPLAKARMPALIENVVQVSIEDNVNLDVLGQINKYSGPLRLIRRTKDEMISTDDDNPIETNRGNDLIVGVLSHRFPKIASTEAIKTLRIYLTKDAVGQAEIAHSLGVSDDVQISLLTSYVQEFGGKFPMNIGEGFDEVAKQQMIIYLVGKFVTEYDASHNTGLPKELFALPWNIN